MSENKSIASVTANAIKEIYNDGHIDKQVQVAFQRSSSISDPRAVPSLPIILHEMPEEFLSNSGEPTVEETAVFNALRLYAIYQGNANSLVYASSLESLDSEEDKKQGTTFFKAVGRLQAQEKYQGSDRISLLIKPVFEHPVFRSTIHALVNVSNELAKNSLHQKIDFAKLAEEFVKYQNNMIDAIKVQKVWGEEYFSKADTTN